MSVAFSEDAAAQISINPFTKSYTQDFNALPASGTGTWEHGKQYFPGWYLFRTAPVTTTLTAGTGSHNAGGLYSFGLSGSTDRALGSIASATSTVGEFSWGLLIQNNTGQTITSLNISYTGEQWRSARAATPQHLLSFWYATGADPTAFNLSPKSDVGWTNVKELDFIGPVFYAAGGALNGNDPANKRYLTTSIPVTIPDKGYVMLRWKDLDEFENDHGLAIDDFSLTWSTQVSGGPTILPVELVSFKALASNNAVQLSWATASEKDNSHFIVERSLDGKAFTTIATITGKGTSSIRSNYIFTDEDPLPSISYYRLKQVDFDGTFEYSKVVSVKMQVIRKAVLYPTITSDVLQLDLPETTAYALNIVDLAGKEVYSPTLQNGRRHYAIEVGKLRAGTYSLIVTNEAGFRQVLRFVKR
ncbi:T9SS C-terminal target domain-containing protein [Pontibacter populi]|uniref:T9SS C-terminal target domain-containing protein n=1 Tax=Pontibacter populi TaxID=890055 RepID=A0ABV1RRS5_9BACT